MSGPTGRPATGLARHPRQRTAVSPGGRGTEIEVRTPTICLNCQNDLPEPVPRPGSPSTPLDRRSLELNDHLRSRTILVQGYGEDPSGGTKKRSVSENEGETTRTFWSMSGANIGMIRIEIVDWVHVIRSVNPE